MNHTIEMRDPRALKVHPAASVQPEWAIDDRRFECLVEDVRDRGITVPLIVDPEDRVVDGRHRLRSAKQLQLAQVPVTVCQPDEVASIILATLIQRRHFTPGQIAYLAFPAFEGAYEEARRRRMQALKRDPNGLKPAKTVEALAAEIGVGRELFLQAAQIHHRFGKDPELKAQFEPRILDQHDPAGLGAVLAGIAGKAATKDKPRPESKQLDLFVEVWDTLKTRLKTWAGLDEDTRRDVITPAIRETVLAMTPDLRRTLRAEIDRAEKSS